ncbi:MAG: radical SAM/Cys-rich domain protein [Oxalobacter sp.]|nr:MAG: radical SAM/Cys-rich domain protein [Oxalobacter sp.]
MKHAHSLLQKTDFPPLKRQSMDTLQVNLGMICNQTCRHCHVNAGPNRVESMSADNIALVLQVLRARGVKTLDLTGGAPELNAHFRKLVHEANAMGCRVIDRCNLTVLLEPGQTDTAAFLAAQRVEITASLPCYLEENVDRQRGNGVFEKSIAALQQLNGLGYGHPDTGLVLNLVYNPLGPALPPDQYQLQEAYRHELNKRYGIVFNHLLTITNMPINRFAATLAAKGQLNDYIRLLKDSFSAANLNGVMCRSLVSVDWQGYLYDCDFNQMLHMPMKIRHVDAPHLRDLIGATADDMHGLPIGIGEHCYGCTAGQGSSCSGALAA